MTERVLRCIAALLLAWFGIAALFERTYRAELAGSFSILRSEGFWWIVGAIALATSVGLLFGATRLVATWSLAAFAGGLAILLVGFGEGDDPYRILLAAPLSLMTLASIVSLVSMRESPSG